MDTNIQDQKTVQFKNYIEKYDEFIDQLKNVFQNDEKYLAYINQLLTENDNQKWDRGVNLSSSIKTTTQFNNFLKKKIKIFSSKKSETYKISISLFGKELPLKKLFNNRPIETKTILWNYLHLLLLFIENYNQNQNRIDKLLELLQNIDTKEEDNVTKNILNIDVNSQTNNMINDVINSFEKSLESNQGEDANPFKDIMKITNMITEKYQDDIESGEINLDGLLNNIQSQIPGLDSLTGNTSKKEKTIIDENFSTADVKTGSQEEDSSGLNIGNMMKMMNSFGGGMGEDIGGLFQMMKKADSIETPEQAENLQKEMNKYLEEKMGVDINQLNENISSLDKKTNIYKNNVVYKIINDILHWAPIDNNGNYDQVFSIVEEVGYNPETGENIFDNQEFNSKEDVNEIMNNLGANNYETVVNGSSGVIIRVLGSQQVNYDTGNDESANDDSGNDDSAKNKLKTHESANNKSANDQSANDESANDESANDESANDESANDESANDESANDESANDESANDESANDESANDESANDESADDESANDESANDESANDESANDESSNVESANDESVNDKSANDESSNVESANDESVNDESADDSANDESSNNSSEYNSEDDNSSGNDSGPTIKILNEDNTDVEVIDNIVILS